MIIRTDAKVPIQRECITCGYISSQEYCQACVLLSKLNQGLPEVTIGEDAKDKGNRSRKVPDDIANLSGPRFGNNEFCGSGCSESSCMSGR